MFQKIPFPDKLAQRQVIFLIYIMFIAVISLLPTDSSTLPIKHIDKVGHFIAYAIMAILAIISFGDWKGRLAAVLLTFIVAFLLEWGQGFSPGRLSNLADGVTNVLGLLAGLSIYWIHDVQSRRQ